MQILVLIAGLLISLALPAVEFDTWEVPWPKSRPRDPFVTADGRVWFVGQGDNYAAYLDPESGEFRRYELSKGTGPHNLIVADNGAVYFAGNRDAYIGLLDANTGAVLRYDMPANITDPHTLVFSSDGNIFFTAQQSNYLGHFNVDSGEVKSWAVKTPRARPYGIKVDSHDQPWVVLLGTNRLATLSHGELVEIEIPRAKARPRRLEITPDDRVWYVDYAEGFVGVYDPKTHQFYEWAAPSAKKSRPYGTALDAKGRFWYVETGPQPNRFIGFDTNKEEIIFNGEIPDSGGAVRHMYYDARRNVIWFGMDTNFIGRARLD
ncbi:MAG: lyase [Gammaproteobacteria bacterium]